MSFKGCLVYSKSGFVLDDFGIREQSEEVVVVRLDTFGIREKSEEFVVVRLYIFGIRGHSVELAVSRSD